MAEMNRFPNAIHVATEEDSDGLVYFVVGETAVEFAEIGKKRKVARYSLDEVQTVEGVVKVS